MNRRSTTVAGVLLGVIALLSGLAACSSGSPATDDGASGTTLATTAPSPGPEVTLPAPEGLPAFYGIPDPLPEGQPGDLLRSEPVAVEGLQGSLYRVMYLSESLDGDPIAVTGLIAVPSGPAPDGGRPVVTWAHGTTGIADECAPSLDPSDLALLANQLLAQGYVVTATDYEGLGTPGRHPYLVGESEGRGVIDIVRTAQQLPGADAGSRYLVWGHSQGGHAALYAGQIAASRAPELDLVGVVAGAPPSQLLGINAALQESPFAFYIGMVAAGLNAGYGDQGAPLDEVLTPEGLDWLDQVDTQCARGLATSSAGLDVASLQRADPASVPEWRELLEANDPGTFTEPIPAPLLIIHGGNDEQIPVLSSAALFAQLCAVGQVEQRWVYPDQTHAGVVVSSFGDMLTWMGHRFAGEPAPDPMQPAGPPVPTTQSCPASG